MNRTLLLLRGLAYNDRVYRHDHKPLRPASPVIRRPLLILLLALFLGLLPTVAVFAALGGMPREGERLAQQHRGGEPTPQSSHITEPITIYMPFVAHDYDPDVYDMVDFLAGDDRLYEVQHSSGSQARHQTQITGQTFYHTKGNEISAEWEELWYTDAHIYRGTDTSPGNGQYYTLRDPGIYGSRWAPRFWEVGDDFYRQPHVQFYDKNTCTPAQGGIFGSWLRFEAYHQTYTFESGITLAGVVQFAWLQTRNGAPLERYYYARNYGLVGWWSNSGSYSYISEIHAPGTRPDNLREEIPCLDRSAATLPQFQGPLLLWPGEHRR